jgi:hypothetical protein
MKFGLALLGVVFLLMNPVGFCAGSPMAQSPSHPCCPTKSAPHHEDSAKTSCVCIDRQPAAPSVPSKDSSEGIAVVAPDSTPQAFYHSSREHRAFERIAFAPQDRCVRFHQILV